MSSGTDKLFALVVGTLLSLLPVFIWTLNMPWDLSRVQAIAPVQAAVSQLPPSEPAIALSRHVVHVTPPAPCENARSLDLPRSVLTNTLLVPPAPLASGALLPAASAPGLEL